MKPKNMEYVLYALIVLTIAIAGFNQMQIFSINGLVSFGNVKAAPAPASSADLSKIIPTGTPEIYGTELKVSFDDVVGGLNILAAMDWDLYKEDSPNGMSMKFADMTDEQKSRYVKIGTSISCEYCCGAKALAMANGQPACGCAHSAAMRALAKYLLTKHGSEYTNEQILDQLTKWKTLFFPKQMTTKLLQKGSTQGSSQLPDMVGGC